MNLAELAAKIKQLEADHKQLEERQRWIERVFESYGIRGLWLSPAKAAPLLGVSADRIMTEIDRAESLRANGRQGDVRYGQHYRNIQDLESNKATWQVHVANFDAVLAIPPDRRKLV